MEHIYRLIILLRPVKTAINVEGDYHLFLLRSNNWPNVSQNANAGKLFLADESKNALSSIFCYTALTF